MAERQLPDFLAYGDLSRHGLSLHGLEQLVAQAEFERVAPGAFIRTGLTADTTAALIAATAKKPQATICLLSALSIHDLTDEIPTRSDIALSRGSQPPRITISPVRWHRFDPATFEVGRTQQSLPGGGRIGLYSPERTILDVFRLRHDWGADLAHAVLRRWLARQGSSPATLLSMAENLPEARPAVRTALQVLL